MAARAEIVPTPIVVDGVAQPTQTTGVAADGHKFLNDGCVFVECNNTHTSALIFTFETPRTIHGLAVAELPISVGAASYKLVGPFNTEDFNQSDGMVYLDYDVTNYALQKVRVYHF
jgi:hypothetical protein